MKKTWSNVSWKIIKDKNQKESRLLKLNSTKAKKLLGWKTVLDFEETIQMTVEWYKNYYNKKINFYNYSINQILTYYNRYY